MHQEWLVGQRKWQLVIRMHYEWGGNSSVMRISEYWNHLSKILLCYARRTTGAITLSSFFYVARCGRDAWTGVQAHEKNLQASPIFNISTPTLAHKVANTQFSACLHKLLIFNTLYLQLIIPHPSSYTSHCKRWPFATRYMPNRGSIAYLSQLDNLAFATRKMPNRKSATQKS